MINNLIRISQNQQVVEPVETTYSGGWACRNHLLRWLSLSKPPYSNSYSSSWAKPKGGWACRNHLILISTQVVEQSRKVVEPVETTLFQFLLK